MSVVMIESPYSGDIDRNIRYLALCGFDAAIQHDECAYASHGWMTQHPRCSGLFVSDYDPKWDVLSRDKAIAMSQRMRHRCDKTVFYIDLGWSTGMKMAKKYCDEHNLQYEERYLDVDTLAKRIEFCTKEFCMAIIDKNSTYTKYLE